MKSLSNELRIFQLNKSRLSILEQLLLVFIIIVLVTFVGS